MSTVTKEELSEIQTIAKSEESIATQVGFIEVQTQTLRTTKDDLINKLMQWQKMRLDKLQVLREKYGPGSLNIDTGEFTSTK